VEYLWIDKSTQPQRIASRPLSLTVLKINSHLATHSSRTRVDDHDHDHKKQKKKKQKKKNTEENHDEENCSTPKRVN
jgi:hypothetical protein